jgi:hypothetical protein
VFPTASGSQGGGERRPKTERHQVVVVLTGEEEEAVAARPAWTRGRVRRGTTRGLAEEGVTRGRRLAAVDFIALQWGGGWAEEGATWWPRVCVCGGGGFPAQPASGGRSTMAWLRRTSVLLAPNRGEWGSLTRGPCYSSGQWLEFI